MRLPLPSHYPIIIRAHRRTRASGAQLIIGGAFPRAAVTTRKLRTSVRHIPLIPIHVSFDSPIRFLVPLVDPVSSQFPSTSLTSKHGHSTSYIYADTLPVYFPSV
jgi:hypothetical protein